MDYLEFYISDRERTIFKVELKEFCEYFRDRVAPHFVNPETEAEQSRDGLYLNPTELEESGEYWGCLRALILTERKKS